MKNDYPFEFAAQQRFIALYNAFNTIQSFAESSLDPKMYHDFIEIKRRLFAMYGKDLEPGLLKTILTNQYFSVSNPVDEDETLNDVLHAVQDILSTRTADDRGRRRGHKNYVSLIPGQKRSVNRQMTTARWSGARRKAYVHNR